MAQFIPLILAFFKVLMFFLNLWKEKDREKAKKKAELAKEIVDAFVPPDKDVRRRKLTRVIDRINRM